MNSRIILGSIEGRFGRSPRPPRAYYQRVNTVLRVYVVAIGVTVCGLHIAQIEPLVPGTTH